MAQLKQRINLYRPVLTARQAAAPKSSWMVAGLVAFTIATAAVLLWDGAQRWKMEHEIAAREVERDRLNAQLAEVTNQVTPLTSGTNAGATVAPSELPPLLALRTRWIELFQELSVRVPDGVWLLRMDVKTLDLPQGGGRTLAAKKKSITLFGFAQSYQRVGQLLQALEQSPKFSSVLLQSAERKAGEPNERVNFEIAGELS
ncbi:MAG TPA: PilN domain-containing protein [Nitrospiria bacterium]|nr:PilN domain-containing protein [Nitrospiria bacterium]